VFSREEYRLTGMELVRPVDYLGAGLPVASSMGPFSPPVAAASSRENRRISRSAAVGGRNRRSRHLPLPTNSLATVEMNMRPVVVFSDVDGLLRNPREPMIKRAAAALNLLTRYRIWTVICSGMTRAEIELIQRDLGLRHPFIAENGAAAFIPRGYFGPDLPDISDRGNYVRVEFAASHARAVRTIRDVAAHVGVGITGFSDMSTEDVARECGLPLSRARAAKLREYSEPIRLSTPTEDGRHRLLAALEAARLSCINRGRFDHVGTVANCNVCVNHLRDRYEQAFGPVVTIGLVDAIADDHLLPLVDHKVMLHADESLPGAIDVWGWALAIRATAQEVRQRAPEQVERAGTSSRPNRGADPKPLALCVRPSGQRMVGGDQPTVK
jgi:mannosyl-3-phosphoglycerate phosphatase family protein